jgi:cation transport ATPase
VAILQPSVAQDEFADLEQGPPEYRKVILQVEGMDCTSCERNLIAAVSQIKAAINVKTSFTLARVEFLLNTNRMGLDEAVINLQKTTKYTFKTVLEENAHSLTIIVDDALSFCQQTRPTGVLDMLAADKHFVELKYDASLIGARKLLKQGFGSPLSLAPDPVDLSAKIRLKKLQRDWIFFLVVAALTVPVLVFSWSPAPLDHEKNILYDGISMALATLVQLAVVWKFYLPAFQDLIFRHAAEVDMLVSLSTTAAYVFSAVSFGFEAKGNPLPSGQFFETSTLLTTIVLLSNLISEMARHTALKSVSIR